MVILPKNVIKLFVRQVEVDGFTIEDDCYQISVEQRTLIFVCICVLFFYSVSLPNRSSAQCVIEHFAVQIVEKSMK